jgi:hypothetical protein
MSDIGQSNQVLNSWFTGRSRAHEVKPHQRSGVERHRRRAENFSELGRARDTDDRCGDARLSQQPSDGDLRRSGVEVKRGTIQFTQNVKAAGVENTRNHSAARRADSIGH